MFCRARWKELELMSTVVSINRLHALMTKPFSYSILQSSTRKIATLFLSLVIAKKTRRACSFSRASSPAQPRLVAPPFILPTNHPPPRTCARGTSPFMRPCLPSLLSLRYISSSLTTRSSSPPICVLLNTVNALLHEITYIS